MKRRDLTSLAHNIGHKFCVSAQYFAQRAVDNRISRVMVDVLNQRIKPELFEEERNLTLVGMCHKRLMELLAESGLPPIRSATVTAEFLNLNAARFHAEIIDDQGHVHRVEVVPQGDLWTG